MGKSNRSADPPRVGSPVVRRVPRWRPWLLGLLYLALLVPLSYRPRISGNVTSRYMTIESIVERGTLAIDSSPLLAGSGSPDLVRFGRHLYSDKPPVLPAIGAVVYLPLFQAGVRFSGSAVQFVLTNWVLVASIVGVSSALTLVWLRQLLQVAPVACWVADLLTLGFGAGSLLLSYAVTFNNHSVAAALVTGTLALTVLEEEPGPGRVRLRRFLAGLLAGLTAAVDLPAGGVLLVAVGIWLMARARTLPWAFVAGALLPLLLHAGLQSLVTGTPLPAEMYPEAFSYPGSYWATAGVWKEPGPRWQFALELLFGPQGWFTVTPILVLSAVGLVQVLRKPGDPLRPLAAAVGGMAMVLLVYYVWGVRRTDYAGQSFGVRHLLAITPACYVFAVVAVGRRRTIPAWAVFLVLLGVGSVYAFEGLRDPWSRIENRARTDPALRALQRFVVYPRSSYRR